MIFNGLKRWMGCASLLVSGLLCFSCSAKSVGDAKEPRNALRKDVGDRLENALNQAREKGETTIDVWPEEDPASVQAGDLVDINYILTLKDGTLLRTNLASVAEASGMNADGGAIYYPESVLVGTGKTMTDISDQLIGMKPGDSKRVVLTPEQGGLAVDPSKIKQFKRLREVPVFMSMALSDFRRQFDGEPDPGRRVQATPYFESRIRAVNDGQVYLESDFTGETSFRDALGATRVTRENDMITLELTPDIGAPFETGSMTGRIQSVDDTHFTVDFNPPLAGKTTLMDLSLLTLVKRSQLGRMPIDWMDDYDMGLAAMAQASKPMVLYLYRQGCPWCERMGHSVFPDPRITSLGPDFIWVKIDSGTRTDIKERFGQQGFPQIVLLNPDQTIYRELKGYRDPGRFRQELRMWTGDLAEGKQVFDGESQALDSGSCDE